MTRIYLIDDHQMVRQGLRGLLEAAGHDVVGESADALTGVDEVVTLRPDIVLLDLMLAEGSGLFFLAEVVRKDIPTKTIVLSMSSQIPHVREARKLGAVGYVLKGSSSTELLEAISTVAQGGNYLTKSLSSEGNLVRISPDKSSDLISSLSIRERQIMDLVVRGKTSAQIASMIFLSPKTVETYRSRLMRKLEVSDLTELVRLAVANDMI